MARKGRPSRSGKREKNGRLQRDSNALPNYDRGSDWVQEMRAKYQTHYSTALGRAFAGKLLGDDTQAQDRYEAGKRFARAYKRVVGGEVYRCPLDRTPRGSCGEIEATDRDMDEQVWLFGVMEALDRSGLRPWLDQLIGSAFTDQGPAWLDRLLDGGNHIGDKRLLDAGINALDLLTPERKAVGIVSAQWHDAA